MFWKRAEAPAPQLHRGRIYGTKRWWKYKCYSCDWGAGVARNGSPLGKSGLAFLIESADIHNRRLRQGKE